jgi:NAD(P)-dependent dehydrogenase (short-subunit alcohol dehydrogenase family)
MTSADRTDGMRAGSSRELEGRVALVTGGGRGLGEATAIALAQAGMAVVVADVQGKLAEGVAARLREEGEHSLALDIDVTREADADRAIARALAEFQRLDVLINNAGVDVTASIDELTIQDWDRVLGVNLRGPFLMAKAALPVMRRQGRGHIVNVVSTAAKRAWPNATAYHASKWGLLGFSHALHAEARPYNVKVTAVVAGGMRTPFLLDRFPDIDESTLQDPACVANTIRYVLTQPEETVIPEIMVLPMRETSWP